MTISRRDFMAGAVLMGAVAGCGAIAGCSPKQENQAEAVYTNGKIFTGVEGGSFVEAVAIADGKFVAVGTAEEIKKLTSEKTVVVDLEGKTAVPGFIDAHNHIYKAVLNEIAIGNLEDCKDIKDYQAAMKKFIEANPDYETYRGHGWLNNKFKNGTPTADLLDSVCSDKPVLVTSKDGHSCWVNSKFMKEYGIDKNFKDIEGGTVERDSEGNPVGCFRDVASNRVTGLMPDFGIDVYKECIKQSEQVAASYGYTGYMNAMINENISPNVHDAFAGLDKDGELIMRSRGAAIVPSTASDSFEQRQADADKWLAEDGGLFKVICVKIFVDGVVEGKTALLKEPYATDPKHYGSDSWASDKDGSELAGIVKRFNEKGAFCHFHTVGDQAVEKALRAIETAQGGKGDVDDVRNSLTHLQILDADQFERFADTGTVAVLNPWGTKAENFFEEIECTYLGKARAEKEYPAKTFVDAGVRVAAATDFPAGDPWNAFDALEAFVNRTSDGKESTQLNPAEGITVEQAITMMSAGSAYALHLEKECGTIAPGMSADMVVLSQDVFEADPYKLHETTAELTLFAGKEIFNRKTTGA